LSDVSTILIVDDEFGIAEVLESFLTDAGHRVSIAINGRQGLQRLAAAKPDLVLLDIMMPILDGPGMLRAMVADPATKAIPVLIMSSLPEATVAGMCSGYAGILRKPFRMQAVFQAITNVLGAGSPEIEPRSES
jgi:DNA-binding response OmpR family regulator